MATVKGIYTFKDTLTPITFGSQDVNFVSKAMSFENAYVRMEAVFVGTSIAALGYVWVEDYGYDLGYNTEYAYFYTEDIIPRLGWNAESGKTVDFGGTPQTVSDEFYAWLLENTEPQNTQIYISTNGRTTLATAGKYCDRNIDVSVNVPSKEAELAEQKGITDSTVDRSIMKFTSDTLTKIGVYGLAYCEMLHTLECPQVKSIERYGLGYCTYLTRVELQSVSNIYGYAFGNSSNLKTLILSGNNICSLKATTAFNSTAIGNGTGYIYVPNDLVESYKTKTNWATFADQIKPISELGE